MPVGSGCMRLFLDDLHSPIDPTWVVVRSYAEAVAYIEANGQPEFVSFDNDLGEPKEGYDFAKFLTLELEYFDFQWAVHSSNPCGRLNITRLLERYNHNAESRPPYWERQHD